MRRADLLFQASGVLGCFGLGLENGFGLLEFVVLGSEVWDFSGLRSRLASGSSGSFGLRGTQHS